MLYFLHLEFPKPLSIKGKPSLAVFQTLADEVKLKKASNQFRRNYGNDNRSAVKNKMFDFELSLDSDSTLNELASIKNIVKLKINKDMILPSSLTLSNFPKMKEINIVKTTIEQ